MVLNDRGLEIVKEFEGCMLSAYRCPAGVWTIGYGHTEGVKPGMVITKAQAEKLLISDLEEYAQAVKRNLMVILNSNQFSALVSFCYNVGEGNLRKSTLLKRVNNEEYESAADEFLKWNKANGRILEGLTRRRKAERALFLSKS